MTLSNNILMTLSNNTHHAPDTQTWEETNRPPHNRHKTKRTRSKTEEIHAPLPRESYTHTRKVHARVETFQETRELPDGWDGPLQTHLCYTPTRVHYTHTHAHAHAHARVFNKHTYISTCKTQLEGPAAFLKARNAFKKTRTPFTQQMVHRFQEAQGPFKKQPRCTCCSFASQQR